MQLKGILILFILFLSSYTINSQVGTWTWMHGSNTTGSAGSYGTQGVSNSSNLPPPRYQCAYWTDLQGNLWIFGGSDGSNNCMADMWKYTVGTNQWTWMSGTQTLNSAGSYGTKGIPSATNFPISRGYGANCWTDSLGFLWLYGGKTNLSPAKDYSDLWKYNTSTNEWTWVFGDDPNSWITTSPYYGRRNIANPLNFPGARNECKSGWVVKNELVFFGGEVIDSWNLQKNDIWKYSIASNQWIWLSGDSFMNNPGVFGTKGVANASNAPPSRRSFTKWKLNDKLYIFGGRRGQDSSYNDIWSFDMNTLLWTWENGSSIANDNGLNPSNNCENSNSIYPSARLENQTVQTNSCSKTFWTFGGASSSFNFAYSDLWLYKADSNKWVRVSGPFTANSAGSYGTLGVPNVGNQPSARWGFGMWSVNDTLYVFGGNISGSSPMNDLWRYVPDQSCISYRLSGSIFNPPTKTNLCIEDTAIVILNTKADSILVKPDTGVSYNLDSTTLYFKPKKNTSYQLIAYGSYCSQYSDTLTFSINLVEKDTTYISKIICPNTSIFFNGNSLDTPGNYMDTLSNQFGCDSFIHLDLNFHKLDTFIRKDTICKTDSLIFNNQTIKIPGVYWDTFFDVRGCDSFVQLTLSNFKDDTTLLTDTICQRSTKFFNGNTINLEGIYWDTMKNLQNCDSFIRLQLVHFKNDTAYQTDTICHHHTRFFNGNNLNAEGVYWDTFVDTDHGCDSFIHFTLVHYIRDTGLDTGYICPNDSFWFNGEYRKTAKIYWDTLPNLKHGCDSIVQFSLILRNPPIFTIRTTVCNGSIVPFHGVLYSSDTIVWDTTRSKIYGCDSFTQFKLKYNDKDTDFHKHIICEGDSHFFNNKFHKISGIYWDSFVNIYTCDSFIIDTLVVIDPDSSFYSDTICFGDSYTFNHQNLKIEGDYRDTLKNRYLCDSFVFFHLFVYPNPKFDTIHYYGCRSVLVNNVSYTASQQFSQVLRNRNNCDSINRLNIVHIKPVPLLANPIHISYCDTFVSQGKKYYNSGNFIDTFRTQDTLNCDSIYLPLILTRKISPAVDIYPTPKRTVYRKGDEIELLAQKATNYLWNTGDISHKIYEKLLKDTFIYQVIAWSEYYLENSDTIYCKDTAYLKIITNDSAIARVPTAFTPNGDGVNDLIYCRGFGIVKLLSFKIYNRLGQLLFISTNMDDGWNGYHKELLQNSDIYYYTYEAESYGGKRVKGEGNFILLR